MKTFLTAIIFMFSVSCMLNSQTSNITYDASTSVQIDAGADVCADQIIINGSISGSGTICQGVLPVSLSSFNSLVSRRTVLLSWVTEWEINNAGFKIERMKSGEDTWTELAFIPGNGTTNEQKFYSYKDEKLSAASYRYRLKQTDFNGGFEYFSLMNEVKVEAPKNFELGQNYPNPSNPKSKINFELPYDGRVSLKLYDILGKEVMTLVDEEKKADYYSIEFDGSGLASGVYFYRIIARGSLQQFAKTMKMVLVK